MEEFTNTQYLIILDMRETCMFNEEHESVVQLSPTIIQDDYYLISLRPVYHRQDFIIGQRMTEWIFREQCVEETEPDQEEVKKLTEKEPVDNYYFVVFDPL
jgi:hypothetical protein